MHTIPSHLTQRMPGDAPARLPVRIQDSVGKTPDSLDEQMLQSHQHLPMLHAVQTSVFHQSRCHSKSVGSACTTTHERWPLGDVKKAGLAPLNCALPQPCLQSLLGCICGYVFPCCRGWVNCQALQHIECHLRQLMLNLPLLSHNVDVATALQSPIKTTEQTPHQSCQGTTTESWTCDATTCICVAGAMGCPSLLGKIQACHFILHQKSRNERQWYNTTHSMMIKSGSSWRT